jgi:energy-coupling factor transporter ATP-binding protein EcfA2
VQIRKVTASNFRGIKSADWRLPDSRFVCLVGPGDSTKTTLLDVVSLVLSPRWNVPFSDADFYNCQVDRPIVLRTVLGNLPPRLLRDDAQGFELSGLWPDGELVHDPEDGTEPCLVVQLKVTDSLEPTWTVIRPGSGDDGIPFSARAREDLGLFRVDERVEAHLRWGRTSALARLTAKKSGVSAVVTSAHRAARAAVFGATPDALAAAATEVSDTAQAIGGAAFTRLRPGLDPSGSSSASALLLHDEDVPLTGYGLGTRRLVSVAIQEKAFSGGEILLIDEVEHGLDPHRLHHLLRHLKNRTARGIGQVLMTTHSPMAIEALQADDISVVRSQDGITTVRQVPSDLDDVQGALRAGPSAILARKVVVCEGKTEMGVIRSWLLHWDTQRVREGKAPHAALGVCQSDGQGSTKAPARARILQELGYPALLVIDNDDPASDSGIAKAEGAGAEVIRWQQGHALEDEIISVLSLAGLAALVGLAAEIKGEESVISGIGARLDGNPKLSGLDPAAWVTATHTIDDIRRAIGATAKGKKANGKTEEKSSWFKQETSGEELGTLLIGYWAEIEGTPLGQGLKDLYAFVYGEKAS